MAVVRPFRALRPIPELAAEISSLPYDVMNRQEAKAMAQGNPHSWLHVIRSEIDLPDEVGDYDNRVYEKAKENLRLFTEEGILMQDEKPMYYIYRQIMKGRVQTGLVATLSIDDYQNQTIKRHELTREAKELDRTRHFDVTGANTEPVFLTYRSDLRIEEILKKYTTSHEADYDFTSEDGVHHFLWVLRDDEANQALQSYFAEKEALYIADGHHRTASAARVGFQRRKENPNYQGDEEFNYFMAVLFSHRDLYIMDYNRVVKDLNGLSEDEFIEALKKEFIVTRQSEAYRPSNKGNFGMYLGNSWYELREKDPEVRDLIEDLDVSILQKKVLEPILGIKDVRKDPRIDFVGGIRGLQELENRVREDMKVAFSMYPPSMDHLLDISDASLIMPPKSTWFEPKLRSGLFVHLLDD